MTISLPVLKALMVGQGINSLAIQVAKRAKQDLSLLLDVLWVQSQDLRAAESTPPRPSILYGTVHLLVVANVFDNTLKVAARRAALH
jgi:hypothetical protein